MPVYGIPTSSYALGGVSGPEPGSWPGGSVETAVVLAGGGNRGALQVGMMRALIERGVVPDVIVGTSIGAINGVAFAGTPTLEGVYLAADVWRRLAAEDIFPKRRFQGTWRFVEKRPSVFPHDGLREVVTRYLQFERLEDATVPLLLVATRLEDGAEKWITTGPAIEAVLASAALPGVFPVVEMEGSHYIDGGVLDNVGISAALSTGARRIYVMLCGRVDTPAQSFARPFEAMFAAFNVALGARLRRDLASVPDNVDVIVVEHFASSMFELTDFSQTDALIEEGYQAARDVFDFYEAAKRSGSGWRDTSDQVWTRLRRAGLKRTAAWRRAPDKPAAQPAGSPKAAARADEVPPGSTR